MKIYFISGLVTAVCIAMIATASNAIQCDNDYYYNGDRCINCPTHYGSCTAGYDEDDATCTYGPSDDHLSPANSDCGVGNDGLEEADNPPITTCRIFSYRENVGYCRYCDTTGCYIYTQDCYYSES